MTLVILPALAVPVMTIIILVFVETLPKTLAPLFTEQARAQLLFNRVVILDGVLDDDNGMLLTSQLMMLAADDPDEDIAPIVLFMASKDSQYMTGYTFMADGGLVIDTAR